MASNYVDPGCRKARDEAEIALDPQHSDYSRHSVVVLCVPEWAAAHAAELRAPLHSEPDDGESTQAVRLARAAGVPVVSDEFIPSRRKPSTLVIA